MLWKTRREDNLPLCILILLPLLFALPQLLGLFHADPALYYGEMALHVGSRITPGVPYIDPNNGFTTQALGYLAAQNWVNGIIPWWNPYSGVGLPLAGEYQPGAFYPLTLLLLLPQGMVWHHVVHQVIAGLGTYALLRQFGLGRLASVTAGLLFAHNGTLAWFDHGPAFPLVFLPWLLFGIERAAAKAALKLTQGWRCIAVSLAMMLLAGFPETAYLCGLFAFGMFLLKWLQSAPAARAGMAWRVAAGGLAGLALSAPQILVFLQYVTVSFVGGHADVFKDASLSPLAVLPSLVAPYALGPIFAFAKGNEPILQVWGNIGGFVDIILLAFALYGFFCRRDKLCMFLLAWAALFLAKTFGVEPIARLVNHIPFISFVPVYRYAAPTWELALVILAAFGIEDLARSRKLNRPASAAFLTTLLAGIGMLCYWLIKLDPIIAHTPRVKPWLAGSLVWILLLSSALIVIGAFTPQKRRARCVSAVLIFNAIVLFTIPVLSNPRHGERDEQAIAFLQNTLGLQRFYTLGPILPNFNAMYNIASINHNYLPVASRWTQWIHDNLDPDADPITFTGFSSHSAIGMQRLKDNLQNYEKLGVKYLVTYPEQALLSSLFLNNAGETDLVYSDAIMNIYQLRNTRPYFESINNHCTIESKSREYAIASCSQPDTLLRRELFYPGWQARSNGVLAEIGEYDNLFQAIELPAGRSEVKYRFTPPHIAYAWIAMWLAILALILPGIASIMTKRVT